MKKIYSLFYTLLLCGAAILVGSCERTTESLDATYGYVQFRLVKESQLDADSRAAEALEWLSEAHKISVIMQKDGSTITQTLPLSSFDAESAEWGLQSEKLRLMTGTYNIIGYYIYDNLDNKILTGGSAGEFTVTAGGLEIKKIGVATVERGIIGFTLSKLFPETRYEAEGGYPFENIKAVDITVKNLFTRVTTTFKAMATQYFESFIEGSYDEELWEYNGRTAYMTCSVARSHSAFFFSSTRPSTIS